VSHCRFWGY